MLKKAADWVTGSTLSVWKFVTLNIQINKDKDLHPQRRFGLISSTDLRIPKKCFLFWKGYIMVLHCSRSLALLYAETERDQLSDQDPRVYSVRNALFWPQARCRGFCLDLYAQAWTCLKALRFQHRTGAWVWKTAGLHVLSTALVLKVKFILKRERETHTRQYKRLVLSLHVTRKPPANVSIVWHVFEVQI